MTPAEGAGSSSERVPRTVNLGRGRFVPYPEPRDDAATKIGKANRRADTKPEVRLRSALHRRGLRFRKDLLVRVEGLRVKPDIVFSGLKLAIFVDGCFWHGCPDHRTVPRSNSEYWIPKLAANAERDRLVNGALVEAGWSVERVWEHEAVGQAAARIETLVTTLRHGSGRSINARLGSCLPGSKPSR